MGFFKSVFSTDPIPQSEEEPSQDANPNSPWNFGGLIKTIASRSESVIQTYRRDLQEFSVELKKETSILKSVAQESIESIISRSKGVPLSIDPDSNSLELNSLRKGGPFEVQVLAIQNDANTFAEPPEDERDFKRWRLGFKLEEEEEEIEGLLYENDTLDGYFKKFVPEVLDRETFWSRYFYRVYRLKMVEDRKAKLGKRGDLRVEEEVKLSWEVDEEEENKIGVEEINEEKKADGEMDNKDETVGTLDSKTIDEEETKEEIVEVSEKPKEKTVKSVEPSQNEDWEEIQKTKYNVDDDSTPAKDEMNLKSKSKTVGLVEGSNLPVISSQTSMQEDEDFSWEEIEDFGEHEKTKNIGSSGGSEGVELRKRLSIAEEDEDLSWDIEDDDDAKL